MKKYLNPEINVRIFDFEDITTTSGVAAPQTAVEIATETIKEEFGPEVDVLTMS